MPPTKSTAGDSINIQPITTETIRVAILGTRPIIHNRLAEKARQELLMPKGRRTTAERAGTLKHVPAEEFRASPYRIRDEDAPTLIGIPASAFKGAMMTAALDLPGAAKTKIGRLLWVEGDLVPTYGVPTVLLAITRSADIGRTPDVRTRAIMEHWAAEIDVTYTTPLLNKTSVINLLAAAGQICGVGDWRPEKGRGTFGQFTLVSDDDERWLKIKAEGGRDIQALAMELCEPYDDESAELLTWFDQQVVERGKDEQIKPSRAKKATAEPVAMAAD